MKATATLLASSLLGLAMVQPQGAGAQPADPPVPASIWDGIFTETQAARGANTYINECSTCHGPTLRGSLDGPGLYGDAFLSKWTDVPVGGLYEYVRTQMPFGRPNSLGSRSYLNIVAHILSVNGYPAGDTELTANEDLLYGILIERPPETPDAPPAP